LRRGAKVSALKIGQGLTRVKDLKRNLTPENITCPISPFAYC
jgi:hypothetical protein